MQELEDPVDARPADGSLAPPATPQRILDLERAERAVLPGEQLDQSVAGSAAVMARALEDGTGVIGPFGVGLRRHGAKLSVR